MMSPTVWEASLPASSVKDQTTALSLEGAAESVDPKGESHLAQAPQRKLLAPTHDDVVMQSQAEILAALLDFFRHGDIRLGWRWITGGVVVDLLCPVFLCAPPSRSVALSMASELKPGT
mgnify:CR=1 FL=1